MQDHHEMGRDQDTGTSPQASDRSKPVGKPAGGQLEQAEQQVVKALDPEDFRIREPEPALHFVKNGKPKQQRK